MMRIEDCVALGMFTRDSSAGESIPEVATIGLSLGAKTAAAQLSLINRTTFFSHRFASQPRCHVLSKRRYKEFMKLTRS
jgi:hypothetical protein